MTSKTRVLVVDDENNIIMLCQQLLEMADFQVMTAAEPMEAIHVLETQEIDVLLADIRLPVMDGFTLAERARGLQPGVAVVLMTGYRTVETAIKALRSGIDGLVIKPYELGSELVEIVKTAVEQQCRKEALLHLEQAQVVFDLASISLLDVKPSSLEKSLAQAVVATTQAQHAGVFARSVDQDSLRLLSVFGETPDLEQRFWKTELAARAYDGELNFHFTSAERKNEKLAELITEAGWSDFLLVATKQRKEILIFLAVREIGQAAFLKNEMKLLTILARQAAMSLENSRLFTSMAEIAARIERSQGTIQLAEMMAVQQRLLPLLLHEINLPLQAVKNNMYLAGRGDVPTERLRSYLATGQKELYRLEQFLQQFLAFSQPGSSETAAMDMEQVVTQVIDQLQPVLKDSGVHVRLNFARPLPAITAARGEIEQVLYHLIMNAVDAMQLVANERKLWIDVSADAQWLAVRIEDDGTGFLQGVEPNLFKPFFTTRPNGTGLGLNICQKIIAAHGGVIGSVPTRQGTGAGMEFKMPVQ